MDKIAQVCFMFVCVACFTCTSVCELFSMSAKSQRPWGRGDQKGSHSRHIANKAKQEEIMDFSYLSLSRKLSNAPFKAHNHFKLKKTYFFQ